MNSKENLRLDRRFIEENSAFLQKVIENELTGRQKCYIIKYYADKKTVRAIASECGVAPSTVSRTIRRGRQKLLHLIDTARSIA